MHSKRSLLVRFGVVILIAAVVVAAVAMRSNKGSDDNMSNMNMSQTTDNTSPATDSSSQKAATDKVAIKDFAFSPANITVKVGTKVTWTNQDNVDHTVTADSGEGPDSGAFGQGKTYSFTFKSAGTFSYHCDIHPSMHGTVTVTN